MISFSSAIDWDNVKDYDSRDRSVTYKNAWDLPIFGSDIAKVTPMMEQNVNVVQGYRLVGMYNMTLYGNNYDNVFKGMEYLNLKESNRTTYRNIDYKKRISLGMKEVDNYDYNCIQNKSQTQCVKELNGTKMEEQFEWVKINNGGDLQNGENIIGLFTNVLSGDSIEYIPTWFGVRTPEYASWTDALNVDLVTYYKMDGSSGVVLDSVDPGTFNATNNGATRSITGKINDAFEFDAGENVSVAANGDLDFTGSDAFSIALWVNQTVVNTAKKHIIGIDGATSQQIWLRSESDDRVRWAIIDTDADASSSQSPAALTADTWFFIVAKYDGAGNGSLWIDGDLKASSDNNNINGALSTGKNWKMGVGEGNINLFDGVIDEVGIWKRELTPAEITQLYNGGTGISFVPTGITITLVSPVEGFNSSNQDVDFGGFIDSGSDIANVSLIINDTYNETNNSGIDNSFYNFSKKIDFGYYNWTYEACNTANSCFNGTTRFFTISIVSITSETFEPTVIELSTQEFIINVSTVSGINIQSGDLIYNGTTFALADKIDFPGNNFSLSKTINIPAGTAGFGSENRSFHWNITAVNETSGEIITFLSNENNQTVNELVFGLCTPTLNVSVLNFTMINEIDGLEINASENASTFQATFLIGSSSDNIVKNISINEIASNKSRFDFCTDNESNTIFTNMALFYTAEGFSNKNYVLTNASLTNDTSFVNLFLLPDSLAIQFFITVERDLFPLSNAVINVEKFFIGDGFFQTVEIDTTDNAGKFTSFLELDKNYRFTVTLDGTVLAIINKTSICEAAPCELLLPITADSVNLLLGLEEAFASNVLYNLSYNAATKIVNFQFIDTTGLATSFRMIIKRTVSNKTGETISDQTLFTSSGSMTFNMSGLNGDFRVDTFISRSPEQFIDFITLVISDFTEQLGILGLLTALLFIIVIIFGIALKPQLLILSIPLALFLTKLMGLISLSNTAIITIAILAGIAVAFTSR